MSMSTYVKFLRDKNDEQYQKYLKIFLACKDANIELPKEVDSYFGGDGLDNEVEYPLEIECNSYRKWNGNMSEGFEIDIKDIPVGVSTIRVYNSW